MNRLYSKSFLSAFLVLATFVFFMGSVQAQDFCVSTSTELQSALNQAAANGEHDTIMVVKGTYYENFVYDSLEGYDLAIKGGYESNGLNGNGPDPALTVLDGGGSSNVLYLNIDSEAGDILVRGITMQNGYTPSTGGAGLYAATKGDVTLENNIVQDNLSQNSTPPGGYGGGVYAEGNSVYLARNVIQRNDNRSAGLFGAGGGAYLVAEGYNDHTAKGYAQGPYYGDGVSEIELWDNIIINNVAYANGGGIFAIAQNRIDAQRNTIRLNVALFSPKGGGAFFSAGMMPYEGYGEAILVNNVISDNRAEGPLETIGGGVYVEAADVTLTHNTVANNEAVIGEEEVVILGLAPAAKGGGAYIYAWGAYTIDVYNNIFWQNDAVDECGGVADDVFIDDSGGTVLVNVFNNNLSYTGYFGPGPLDVSNQNNDLTANNPDFVDEVLQDYHLLHTSPCIFAALVTAPQEPVDDRDQLPRPMPVGTAPDIGAYELQACDPTVADFSATPTQGYNDLTVYFTDLSTGDKITAWDWDFGDGSTHGTVQNPSHTYTTLGKHTVTLTVTACDGTGTDTEKKVDYIDVLDCSVTASFTIDPESGEGPAPLTIQFTDTSTGDVYEWAWIFGDGSSSTEQSPEHTYHNYPGTYTAELRVLGCNDWQGPYTTTINVGYPEGWEPAYDTLFRHPSDLTLLRQYRDEFLSKTTKGKLYTKLLYNCSEKALQVLLRNPELLMEAKHLIEANKDAVSEVLNGNEGVIYNTDEIVSFLKAYAKKSPPDLKLLAITVEKEMLRQQRQGEKFLGFRLK